MPEKETKLKANFLRQIFHLALISYATCRTAKQVREMPESAARLSQAQYPAYNIREPNGNAKFIPIDVRTAFLQRFCLSGPGTYAFGFEIEDPATGNVQFRDEEKLRNGTVQGSYGVLLPDNTIHITRYIADQFGYR